MKRGVKKKKNKRGWWEVGERMIVGKGVPKEAENSKSGCLAEERKEEKEGMEFPLKKGRECWRGGMRQLWKGGNS